MLTAPRKPMRRFKPEAPTLAIGSLERQSVELACGRVTYLRHGPDRPDAPALLLVHGIPTSARLWEPLLGLLGERYDCIVPDLLGLGRSRPVAGAELASPGQADMLAALLDALGIETCHAIFHDQGGAHGAQMLKRHGARIRATVFTDCVCYDNWPVPIVELMARLGSAVKPLAALRLMQIATRLFAWPLTTFRGPLPAAALNDWEYALNSGGRALDDWIRYTTAQSARWSLDAVPTLQAWDKPTRVIWAAQDRFLPPSWGIQLATDIPGADNPVFLPFAGHFWQMEVPVTGAQAIRGFLDGL